MALDVQIISGPPSDKVKKEAAEAKLKNHPAFPKGASYEISEVDGRWVAAIAKAEEPKRKQAAPPPGPPEEIVPDGDVDIVEPGEELLDLDEGPGPEEDGDKGLEAKVEEAIEKLDKVIDALGISDEGDELLEEELGGEDIPELAPPPPPGPGPEGPPREPTPVGAPAFASVSEDHPWHGIVGKKKTFTLEEPIGDQRLSEIREEIESLAQGTGYEIKQLVPGKQGNTRTAKVLMQHRG